MKLNLMTYIQTRLILAEERGVLWPGLLCHTIEYPAEDLQFSEYLRNYGTWFFQKTNNYDNDQQKKQWADQVGYTTTTSISKSALDED